MSLAKFAACAVGATALGWTISSIALVVYFGHAFADIPLEDEPYTQHARDARDRWFGSTDRVTDEEWEELLKGID